MSNIVKVEKGTLANYVGGMSDFAQEFLNAIPLALAAPILAYQKTRSQARLMEIAIEAKRRERTEILKTIQVLATHGQLTDELARELMFAYNAQPY